VVTRYVTAEVVVGPEDTETTTNSVLNHFLRIRVAAMSGMFAVLGTFERLPPDETSCGRRLACARMEMRPSASESIVPPPRKKGARR
jgi:hypothetical protein